MEPKLFEERVNFYFGWMCSYITRKFGHIGVADKFLVRKTIEDTIEFFESEYKRNEVPIGLQFTNQNILYLKKYGFPFKEESKP